MRYWILLLILLVTLPAGLKAQPLINDDFAVRLTNEYQAKGSFFIDKRLRDVYSPGLAAHRNDFERLQTISFTLASQSASHGMVLKLLKKYQDHDGVPLQLLCSAILKAADSYNQSDLPFLKQVFLLSLSFKDTDVYRHDRTTSPAMFRYYLAPRINIILGLPNPIKGIEETLPPYDPKVWIEKKIP